MSTEIAQPLSSRERWLIHCEHELARATEQHKARKPVRMYEVTRPVAGEPMTTLWTEQLVRWFLAAHRYVDHERWLRWFAEDRGAQTSFGWVKLKPSKEATSVSQTQS